MKKLSTFWQNHIIKKANCCGFQLEELQKMYEEQHVAMEMNHDDQIDSITQEPNCKPFENSPSLREESSPETL